MPLFTSIGSLGTVNQKVSATTGGDMLSFSLSRSVAAGRIVVIWIATDSVYNIAIDDGGPMQDRVSVRDTALNDWHLLAAQTGTKCYFYCSAYITIVAAQLKAPISTSDLITISVGGLSDCTVVSAWEFALPDGYGFAEIDTRFQSQEGIAIDPPAFARGYEDSQEYLLLHGLASEGPFTDSYTWDAAYTQIDPDGTTGGADDTNITLRGGWKIATGNSFTVDVTNNTAARDTAQVFGGITPIAKPLLFPRSPLLDDFNRADEEPIDGGTWDTVNTSGPRPWSRYLRIASNEAAGGSTNAGGQWWGTIFECNDVEVWATWSYFADGVLGIDVNIHGSGSSDDVTAGGYDAQFRPHYASGRTVWLVRLGAEGFQGGIAAPACWIMLPSAPASGWKIGIQRRGDFNHLWCDRLSGWEWMGSVNTQGGNSPRSGKLGLQIWDPISRVDDFGGGENCYLVATNVRNAQRQLTTRRKLVNPSE